MRITFKDKYDDELVFTYHSNLPPNKPNEKSYKPKTMELRLFELSRDSTFDSYRKAPNLAEDIKHYPQTDVETGLMEKEPLYQDPIYRYAVAGAFSDIKEWRNSTTLCYLASEKNGHLAGFVLFYKIFVNEKPVVYISQAAVENPGKGVGRRLMQCVLCHYPAGTEFYALTRVFNTQAITLYQKRLGFGDIMPEEVTQLGYDQRYCGFKHTTSPEEIDTIRAKQIIFKDDSKEEEQPSLGPAPKGS